MDDSYFEDMGFMCGMEIHQQLKTQRKLFCRCPPVYRNDPPHYTILRHMRPTLSEMGTYDGTALMEFKTRKNVTYQFYRDTCCSYEIDDTPPFEMDEEALVISLVIASALNSHLVDEVHVSRKQYLDGTIPTGFQRTAIVSLRGRIPWKDGRDLDIRQISLEEDACREVSDIGHEVTFRTDRLSIPLVEVVTEPVAKNPTEAREISERIGRVMRSTGLVRRGAGATRQDVNVSIKGGKRVEIKGVPKLDLIPTITAGEAIRQHNLLLIAQELERRGLDPGNMDVEEFNTMSASDVTAHLEGRHVPSMSHIWPETVRSDGEHRAMAVLVPGFNGLFSHITHHSQRFIDEISGRVRVIACLDHLPNVFSSDMRPPEGMDDELYARIMAHLGGDEDDAFVLVAGNEADTLTAVREIYIRCREAFDGVPHETRQVIGPDETSFERILPGPDRMYPDTDRPPIVVTPEILARVRSLVPSLPYWEEEEEMRSLGVSPDNARMLVVSELMPVYKKALSEGCSAPLAARTLMETFKDLMRKGHDTSRLGGEHVLDLLRMHKDGAITLNAIPEALRHVCDKGGSSGSAVRDLVLEKLERPQARRSAEETAKARPELAALYANGDKGRLLGAVMASCRGRIDSDVVIGILDSMFPGIDK
ncbi:MAG: Glu-tRNA(Gln) amidotransferase subunit GatE [Candidatus Thermoplasmatota archaeon]|nr:Glu-tRNA(Gln) amidotransferase subunit GatE [Candidatus Thermoplasmatota archaeon]